MQFSSLTPTPFDAGVALLQAHAPQRARAQVRLVHEDGLGYRIAIEGCARAGEATTRVPELPTRAAVMPWLPAGSRWDRVAGWRSFVLGPLPRRTALLGVAGCATGGTAGGAARFAGWVLPEPDVAPTLDELAHALDPAQLAPRVVGPLGIVTSPAHSAAEHVPYEAALFRRGVDWVLHDGALALRTLILSEEEVPPVGLGVGDAWSALWRRMAGMGGVPKVPFLGATVPALRNGFSGAARRALRWYALRRDGPEVVFRR